MNCAPMLLPRRSSLALLLVTAVAACSGGDGGTGPGTTTLDCTPAPAPTVLNPGDFSIQNPSSVAGCVRLPAAGASGAEYLIAALSTAGQEAENGVTIDYALQGASTGASPAPPMPSPLLAAFRPTGTAEQFHIQMRVRERLLSSEAGVRIAMAPPILRGPPVIGTKDTFRVCGNTACSSFVSVIATAMYVGPKGAIYLDDVVPSGGFTQADIDTLGLLFDGGIAGATPNMYEIDTTAFGRESDIDSNGSVLMLLTDAVNNLSGTCANGSIILGFFYGGDLLPRTSGNPGSNEGEIFYGLVPKSSGSCAVSKDYAKRLIAPTFIHEFQHMISFNQHVLARPGVSSEQVWLNEGLSHFAEELGGRLLGNGPGQGGATSRLSQFAISDLLNANDYLLDPEAEFLIYPASSTGALAERGASWLFVRWLADHYGTDDNGTNLTRALVGTSLLGYQNVEAATGASMATLVPLWQMANYLDNLPGFASGEPRLQYPSWDFRYIYDTLNAQAPDIVPRPYPLAPDSTKTGAYSRTGTLRGGSGRHLRVIQAANAAGVDVMLARKSGDDFPSDRGVRFGVVRIR